jgi:hypothetical protein
MIAEKDLIEIKPVEKAPSPVEEKSAIARYQPQQMKNRTFFIGSDVCLLVGLLLIVIALLLPPGVITAIETVLALRLVLLITEVSLFVVGAELFVLGFIWPRIK